MAVIRVAAPARYVPVEQPEMANPFGMDESCPACPELVEHRERVVHGYGDVAADFMFIGEAPSVAMAAGNAIGDADDPLRLLLDRLGFISSECDESGSPRLTNAYLTHLTRCRHPDRPPSASEIEQCAAFLSAEIRMINPELLIPIGERVLQVLAEDHTTKDPETLELPAHHAEAIRGRGFEVLPMCDRPALSEARRVEFIDAMEAVMGRDYRQTKGRRGR